MKGKKDKLMLSTKLGIAVSSILCLAGFLIIGADNTVGAQNVGKDMTTRSIKKQYENLGMTEEYSGYLEGKGKDKSSFVYPAVAESQHDGAINFHNSKDINIVGFELAFNESNSTSEVVMDGANQSIVSKDHAGVYTGKSWHSILNQVQYLNTIEMVDFGGYSTFIIINPQDTEKALAVIEGSEVIYDFMNDK